MATNMDNFVSQIEAAFRAAGSSRPSVDTDRGPTLRPCSGCDAMRRAGLDDAPQDFGTVLDAMRSDSMPGGRGWVLFGGTGCGKTARARLAARFCDIRLRAADAMVQAIMAGDGSRADLLDAACMGLGDIRHRYPVCDLIIDDLGREVSEAVMWGTRRDIMREILEMRLDAWPYVRTYITTNLTEQEISRRYGERVASRMAGACVLLAMPERDWRRTDAGLYGWGAGR